MLESQIVFQSLVPVHREVRADGQLENTCLTILKQDRFLAAQRLELMPSNLKKGVLLRAGLS